MSQLRRSAFATAETDILSMAKRCKIQRAQRRVVAAFGGASRSMRWRNTVAEQSRSLQVNRVSECADGSGARPTTGKSVRTRSM